jgi:hypothetical protein
MQTDFKNPPKLLNVSGEERTVGYEFEFTGIKMVQTAEIVANLYGGKIQRISAYEYEIENTSLGTFKLELDTQLLLEKKYEKLLQNVGIDLPGFNRKETIEEALMEVASKVVPFEIVTPPVRLSEMYRLNNMVDELRKQKAKGTRSSFMYAFGLHINPEIPDERAESLLNHLRAYVLLDPWIRKDAQIDISRRITPYINEYEEKYVQLILNPDYHPGHEQLIADYFAFDNSRNRPLDLLPVFMYLNYELTSSMIEETLTSSRPTFHYRLPNCSIDNENWSFADEWNRWVWVEKLADDVTALHQYSRAWLKIRKKTLIGFERKWIELMERWVADNE